MARQLRWLKEYDVGNREIDENRKMLFEIVKNLYATLSNREASHTIIGTALNVFKEQAEICFKQEGDYLESIGFPCYRSHKDLHKSLLLLLDEKIRNLEESEDYDMDVYREIFDYLNKWGVEHIIIEDMVIKEYIDFVSYIQENDIDIKNIKL